MKIELTDKQYRDLIELLFLGDWIANASRTGADGDERIEKYEKVQDYILSQAKHFHAEDIVKKEGNEFYTTMNFEEPLMPIVEEYDDYTFWEQISNKLAKRDLLREIGPVRQLKEEHRDRMYEIEEQYEIEFEENGLKNLVIMNKQKEKPNRGNLR
ncbi:hypothetical protein [Cohnella sp.]|uniref:hypothetical protein n=1 Tax=Cohnella sp. TaxID=1883426 RepID=UPI00356AE802